MMRKLSDIFHNGFILGFAFCAFSQATYQDWLGLEDYILWCRQYWWEMHWIIPGMATFACVVRYVYITNKVSKDDDNY